MQLEKNISIVIPARNAASSIPMLLRSLRQDLPLIQEILLIDDGSEDATSQIAQHTAQRYGLPLFVFQVSFGSAGAARNFGIKHACGRFLFFIDADDELIPGALTILTSMLTANPSVGLAVGSCIRRTASRQDKIKIPHGYSSDRVRNVERYLANELWPIAMGSALVVTSCAASVRFPETISLDEDTCYWTALLARVDVVTTPEPILLYQLDETRMAQRYAQSPRRTLLGISREFRKLIVCGVDASLLKRRIAWVALRIARQLIIDRRYTDADGILRLARAHPQFCRTWNLFRYLCRVRAGKWLQRAGLYGPRAVCLPLDFSTRKLRTLIFTVDSAADPVSGADLRNHQNALSAGKLGSVRVVSIRPKSAAEPTRVDGVEFLSVGVSGEKSKSLSPWRCSVETRISHAVLQRIVVHVRDFEPDRILVEGIPLAALLKNLRPLTSCLILDMHNIESNLASQHKSRSWGFSKLRTKYAVARIHRLERQALARVDRVWVCSMPDRDRLIKCHSPDMGVFVVPNSIPRSCRPRSEGSEREVYCTDGPVMLFAGHLGYWPNVTAAERLAKKILPVVRSSYPAAKVILAGRYPNPVVQAFASLPGIELHGNPKNLVALYERAHIAVVPLTAGGGTRIKILEAMMLCLPVVATHVAIEGLDLVDGEDVLTSNSDDEMAHQIIDLWKDSDRRQELMSAAEQTVRLRYGSAAIDFAVKDGLGYGLAFYQGT